MIPVKLSLRNFMCYREDVPPLLFDGIHTACISGDNGNGKSALIDAMTWALWGKARAKSDDDLIYLGQAEMGVEFEFAVSQQKYRIIRKHSRPKKASRSGQTILELQIATNGDFRPISGDSITQTQQKIIDILHMDYVTFTNSALLLQGRADEFTTADPATRKKILASILELSVYDELESKAKEIARQREMERLQLESGIKEISDELIWKPAYETEFARVQGELDSIERTLKEQETRLSGLRQKKESLESKKSQLSQLEDQVGRTKRDIERWQEQAGQHEARVKDYESLIAQRSAIEENYGQFVAARKLNEELNRKLALLVRLNNAKKQLEDAIAKEQNALSTRHAVTNTRIQELETRSERLPELRNELQRVQSGWQQISALEETLQGKKLGAQALRTQINYLDSGKTRFEQEIKDIGEKLGLLLDQTGAKCPLCDNDLGPEGLKLIETKYEEEKLHKTESLALSQAELARKQSELTPLDKEIAQLEIRLTQDRAAVQSRESVLKQRITEATEASNKLGEERKILEEIEQRLTMRNFAVSEQQRLHELEVELAGLNYNQTQHEQLQQQLASLQQYEEPKRRLEEAEKSIVQEKEAASRAKDAILELQHGLEINEQQRQVLTTELGSLTQILNDLATAENENMNLIARQKQIQQTLGSVREKLQRCSELEVKKKEKEELLTKAAREEEIYRALAQAFGKKGVQALLIETALPEIENEANRLLGRMTDNRMHVKFETQKETKKGDLQETLDINISDELGTRPYEMYSGGEAFRINFAIRIALSKLLARRAGAPLPTLVIDEGFGTQDSTGLEKVKEAINSIQDDFEKILVITHIDELRDAFPTRIEVTKTADGSAVSLS